MTKVRYVVVPLTMVDPMPKSADAFADGWSKHVVIDVGALRNLEDRIQSVEEENRRLWGADADIRFIPTKIMIGSVPYETELAWSKDSFEVNLRRHLSYSVGSDRWSHPIVRSLSRDDIYETVDEAARHPDWSLVNRHTVRCGATVVTTLTPDSAYKEVDYRKHRTLWHQMDQMRGLGWVPTGLNAFIKHEGGLPKPSDKLKHIIAEAKLEGKVDWEIYKVLHRLYEKLGGR